ncbi:MAG TPA: hypothetical protein PKA03_16875 [Tabrizicola sp.]|nr:hypothetical protein [Tabrizicola sp.]
MGFAHFSELFHSAALFYGTAVLFVLVVMMPARVLQKRHGYSPWLLVVGLLPYVGPICLLWALALSSPKNAMEA